jgi:hypothetical protein
MGRPSLRSRLTMKSAVPRPGIRRTTGGKGRVVGLGFDQVGEPLHAVQHRCHSHQTVILALQLGPTLDQGQSCARAASCARTGLSAT